MKKHITLLFLLVLDLMVGISLMSVSPVHAQSPEEWTDPVNLSNSGSSKDPLMVIDDQGVIHVFWIDALDGYKYANSPDGKNWTQPTKVKVPFPTQEGAESTPVFLVGTEGNIHILWKDIQGALQYKRTTSANLGSPSTWTGNTRVADSVVKFDAVMDSLGGLHISYIDNKDDDETPAGIYYKRLTGKGWLGPTLIYPSKYYRSLDANAIIAKDKIKDDANVRIATSNVGDSVNVYIAWDDRTQRRIFLTKSPDRGETWNEVSQVRGPEDFSGAELPYNINLSAADNKIVLVWQDGIPDGHCVVYSQWSTDGGKQFGRPLRILDDSSLCPKNSRFVESNKDFSVALFDQLVDQSFMAWNGSTWSKQSLQSQIASFINPATFDTVIMGCQSISPYKDRLYLVGCDTGNGGDIWFSSHPIGSMEDWFTSISTWDNPITLTTTDKEISSLTSIADQNSDIHNIWVQNLPNGGEGKMIQHSMWDGEKWSNAATIFSGSKLDPSQLTLSLDSLGRLLLTWVDNSSGEMFFTWANSKRAHNAAEWATPVYIPSVSSANSSPDMITDASGRMMVVYAVPINEERGIYIVESDDGGSAWSKPYRVFDAFTANWQMVDQPKIALTEDGRLHVLFERYSLSGQQRRSEGLYYLQSSDGGATWSQPELVSEKSVLWYELFSSADSTLHRVWQEKINSVLVTFHQLSSDGGMTWSTADTISTISDETVLNYAVPYSLSDIYLMQLSAGNGKTSLLTHTWDGSGWKIQDPKAISMDVGNANFSSMTASISPNGQLVTSIQADFATSKSEHQSEIFSLSQALKPVETVPPFSASISGSSLVQAEIQADSSVNNTVTPTPPSLADMQDSGSFLSKNRYIMGLLFLGGILALMFFMFWSGSSAKKKSE